MPQFIHFRIRIKTIPSSKGHYDDLCKPIDAKDEEKFQTYKKYSISISQDHGCCRHSHHHHQHCHLGITRSEENMAEVFAFPEDKC